MDCIVARWLLIIRPSNPLKVCADCLGIQNRNGDIDIVTGNIGKTG